MQSHPEEPASLTTEGVFFRAVRADSTEIAHLRRAMRQWLANLNLGADREQDILLASYEALANAVEHAYDADDESATVDLEATYRPDERRLEVIVTDRGRWRDAVDDVAHRSRGHGLTLIRNLSTETVVTPGVDGTLIAMRWLD